jgi:hypothetical protein
MHSAICHLVCHRSIVDAAIHRWLVCNDIRRRVRNRLGARKARAISVSKQVFTLVHATARQRAAKAIADAADGYRVVIAEPKRTDLQNDRFHAMCGDIAKQCEFHGKKRSPTAWKVLLVSGHAIATGEGAEIIPGLEGEFVNIRESTAQMSTRRGASLIEYTRAWGDTHGVVWSEPAPPDH